MGLHQLGRSSRIVCLTHTIEEAVVEGAIFRVGDIVRLFVLSRFFHTKLQTTTMISRVLALFALIASASAFAPTSSAGR